MPVYELNSSLWSANSPNICFKTLRGSGFWWLHRYLFARKPCHRIDVFRNSDYRILLKNPDWIHAGKCSMRFFWFDAFSRYLKAVGIRGLRAWSLYSCILLFSSRFIVKRHLEPKMFFRRMYPWASIFVLISKQEVPTWWISSNAGCQDFLRHPYMVQESRTCHMLVLEWCESFYIRTPFPELCSRGSLIWNICSQWVHLGKSILRCPGNICVVPNMNGSLSESYLFLDTILFLPRSDNWSKLAES